jgi:cytochrome P450
MTAFADRWGFGQDRFWLRGERPKELVEFDGNLGCWVVYGYPEAIEVFGRSEEFSTDSSSLFNIDEEMAKYIYGDLTQMTGAEHAHLRGQVAAAFDAKAMEHLESRILRVAVELLDRVKGKDRFDLLGDFVDDLSGIVFTELLGIPAEDRALFNLVNQSMDSEAQMTAGEAGESEEYFESLTAPLQPLRDMLGAHIDERVKRPRGDLLSLVAGVRNLDGNLMSRDQSINFIIGMLGAGHLATPLLIGNTMLCLESHPDQAARVRADRSLVQTMLDETMRFLTPANATFRATTAEVELAGTKIPKDQLVRVTLPTANRDARQFTDPDTFDVSRSPNPHLGFGYGNHYCLGRQMIRVETGIVFNLLLDRFPNLHVDPDTPPAFFASPDFTGVKSLTVATDA